MKKTIHAILLALAIVIGINTVIHIFIGGTFPYPEFDKKYNTNLSDFYAVYGGKRELTRYGIRYEYRIVTEEKNEVFLYFTEGDQIQDPGELQYSYKLQNSMKQKCGEYNVETDLYELTYFPVDKDNFSAMLHVRYSNEKGIFLLKYFPEKVWTGKPSEDTYKYNEIDSVHQKDLEILRKIIDRQTFDLKYATTVASRNAGRCIFMSHP